MNRGRAADLVADKAEQVISIFWDLKRLYLDPHIPTEIEISTRYDSDVKAFAVLAIAAVEHFIEDVADAILDSALSTWRTSRELNKILASLSAWSPKRFEPDDDNAALVLDAEKVLDIHLAIATKRYRALLRDNNGASPKYIKSLFQPLGVTCDIPLTAVAALVTLSTRRHRSAHAGLASIKMAAEDAWNSAADVLILVRAISIVLSGELIQVCENGGYI